MKIHDEEEIIVVPATQEQIIKKQRKKYECDECDHTCYNKADMFHHINKKHIRTKNFGVLPINSENDIEIILTEYNNEELFKFFHPKSQWCGPGWYKEYTEEVSAGCGCCYDFETFLSPIDKFIKDLYNTKNKIQNIEDELRIMIGDKKFDTVSNC